MQEDREQRKKMDTIKKIKTIKTIVAISGGSFPVVLVLMLVFASAVAALLPIFMVTTMVGGETVYGSDKSDLPNDLTIEGIDTWSDDEKKMFNDMTKEKEYFDNDFSNYNATEIMANKDDVLDVSTPISTIHYRGVVNLTTFDEEYMEELFSDGTLSTDYNDEKNVRNNHTRNFYEQNKDKIGNTFMIYPGLRMLLGNLVGNSISFYTVEYKEWKCGIDKNGDPIICNNSAQIYSDWSLLGKINASTESAAKQSYSVSETIGKINSAINYGKPFCNIDDDQNWEALNKCFDTKTLYEEIFGEMFDGSIVKYLEDKYDAHVPQGGFSVGEEYIAVSVRKKTNYDLYGKYLKEVYIPYTYINCDSCGFEEANEGMKEDYAESIYKEIMQLTSAFKHYNNEDYANGSTTIGTGGFGRVVPSSGFDYLPDEYYNQFISPLIGQGGTTTLSSCVGYYDALENTSYYCTGHDAVDIVGGGGTIVAPADGVITFCSTNYGNWGPLLGITHTLKDKDGNDTKVTSWYRHWVDLNGNVDCSTLYEARVVKQGEQIAKESNQAGSYSVARHLHFKLTASDGTVYYIEDFLKSKGVNTSSINGTTDCDQVRRTCNAYCEDKRHGCTSTY